VAHPNEEHLKRFMDAYAANDADALRGLLADDAVWHVGGTHPLSGDYRGVSEILDYFNNVGAETKGTIALHPIEIMANDTRGATFLRVTASREGRELDVTMAEAFTFDEQGRIREFWAHATDQNAIDEFWRKP